ncbi:MAG TPA: TauD/TfdA family dioxygenase [Streptosporangiaceae bacterium]|nr:TauD/TfdA family dioxygenase [Streptosporangiaceae bacterium]
MDGYALISLEDHAHMSLESAMNLLDDCLSDLAEPIRIFANQSEWRPIGVKLDRAPDRSEGVGQSPLHMDFVNAQNPPDLVMLYCQRPDPAGGGQTTLAPISAVAQLDDDVREILRDRRYSDGQVVNLLNVGIDINPFAVLNRDDSWSFRYTERLLKSETNDETLQALQELDKIFRSSVQVVSLRDGDAVLINQHMAVHGRLPLGNGQYSIPSDSRRLIWQRFGRTQIDHFNIFG